MIARLLAACGMAALHGTPATLAQDGASVFESCRSCHAITVGAPPQAGPNLHGVLGRRIAGDGAFDYSSSLSTLGGRGERWTRETLDRYLEDPEEAVPGTWMSSRVPDPGQRAALLDFLANPASR